MKKSIGDLRATQSILAVSCGKSSSSLWQSICHSPQQFEVILANPYKIHRKQKGTDKHKFTQILQNVDIETKRITCHQAEHAETDQTQQPKRN
jgi:hypothetical protein